MIRLSRSPRARGLCLFDPKQSKSLLAQQIRSAQASLPIHVAEQFGPFEPSRMEPFFEPIRNPIVTTPRGDAA